MGLGLWELQSKVLKGGCMGEYYGGNWVYTRIVDYN